MRPRRRSWLRHCCLIAAIAGFVALCTTCIVASRILVAAPGEWSTPVRIGLRNRGPVVAVRVAPLLRAATSPVGVLVLDGRTVETGIGQLRFTRMGSHTLVVACAKCHVHLRGLGAEPMSIDDLRLTVTRRGSTLEGSLTLATIGGRWVASLDDAASRVDMTFDRAPLSTWYGLFADRIPESGVATIGGSAAFDVHGSLPDGALVVEPSIQGFTVRGLGTERLAGRMPAIRCAGVEQNGKAVSTNGWLARAVIAAEDRRYLQHPGYDVAEVAAALSRNAASDRVERGASTLSQQLARILFVGSDRTVTRKLRELLYAVEMEDTLGKPRILKLYLAVAPWRADVCGAESAARRYFGVGADRLDAAQSVWLAAMLHAPDLEARRWVARGGVDLDRARWVVDGLAATRRARKARIVADLTTMAPLSRRGS